jgi:hypothetical protein
VSIPLESLREHCTPVSAAATAAQVLALAQADTSLFMLMLEDEDGTPHAMTLASASDLRRLPKINQPIGQLRSHLPSLITIEPTEDTVDEETLVAMALLLSANPNVPGVLFESRASRLNVLGRLKIASALSLEWAATRSLEGDSSHPSQPAKYICRKCAPPSYRICCTASDSAPQCQVAWFHGPMQIDEALG